MKNFSSYIMICLKGIAMGAANVIPGVSGGTIAFITGILERLMTAIRQCDRTAIDHLVHGRFKAFWRRIDGNFLLALLVGIALATVTLSKLMLYLLNDHAIDTKSFFFGLIIASVWLMVKDVKQWNAATVIGLLAGVAIGYGVTILTPTSTPDTWWFIMISGALAICAMVLPGISGSFILLLLCKYEMVMHAVSFDSLQWDIILFFGVGALVGILAFSHLFTWLLKHYRSITMAVLIGFMAGGLNALWPWKRLLGEANYLPSFSAGSDRLWFALLWCVVGFLLIWGIEAISSRISRKL